MADEKKDTKPEKKVPAPGKFDVGARVKFYATHNKALELVGTVLEVGNDLADVEVEPDGKIFEVEQVHVVPVSELRPAGKGDTNRHVGDRG